MVGSNRYAADFETTTDANDCRVWAYSVYGIDEDEFIYGILFDDIRFLNIFNSFEELIDKLEYNNENDLVKINNLEDDNMNFVRFF